MLRIPDSAWRITAGGPQIAVQFLRKFTPQAKRFTQWVQRTHTKLLGAPKNVLSYCTFALIEGKFPDVDGWVSAGDALALLTYSVHSSTNADLINAIESKSGIQLPVAAGESKLEGQFGQRLRDVLAGYARLAANTHYEIVSQKKIGSFRVDFLITEQRYTDLTNGETVKRQFIIEFDEVAHRKKRYQQNDERRDRWFRQNRSEIKLIRVRHEEQELWFDTIRHLKRLVNLEDCYAHCLRKACSTLTKTELLITSNSSDLAYKSELNECHFLLRRPLQRLREMKTILQRLEIPYSDGRSVSFKRAHLRRLSL